MIDSGWVSILVEGGDWETRFVAVNSDKILIRTAIEKTGTNISGWKNVQRANLSCYKPPEARSYGIESELVRRGVYWSTSSKELRDLIFAVLLNSPKNSNAQEFPKCLLPMKKRSCIRSCALSPFIESSYSSPLLKSYPRFDMGRMSTVVTNNHSPRGSSPKISSPRVSSPRTLIIQPQQQVYYDVARIAKIEASILTSVLSVVALSSNGLQRLIRPSQIALSYSVVESSFSPLKEVRSPSPKRVCDSEIDRLIKSCMDSPPPVEVVQLPISTMSVGDIATEMIQRIMKEDLEYSCRSTASPLQPPEEANKQIETSQSIPDTQLSELLKAGWQPPNSLTSDQSKNQVLIEQEGNISQLTDNMHTADDDIKKEGIDDQINNTRGAEITEAASEDQNITQHEEEGNAVVSKPDDDTNREIGTAASDSENPIDQVAGDIQTENVAKPQLENDVTPAIDGNEDQHSDPPLSETIRSEEGVSQLVNNTQPDDTTEVQPDQSTSDEEGDQRSHEPLDVCKVNNDQPLSETIKSEECVDQLTNNTQPEEVTEDKPQLNDGDGDDAIPAGDGNEDQHSDPPVSENIINEEGSSQLVNNTQPDDTTEVQPDQSTSDEEGEPSATKICSELVTNITADAIAQSESNPQADPQDVNEPSAGSESQQQSSKSKNSKKKNNNKQQQQQQENNSNSKKKGKKRWWNRKK